MVDGNPLRRRHRITLDAKRAWLRMEQPARNAPIKGHVRPTDPAPRIVCY